MMSILHYTDYRDFLKRHVELKRRQNSRWSVSLWARRLGLGATASLNMILNGQRHPGPRITDSLVRYFSFNPDEREHFLELIALAKLKEEGAPKKLINSLLADFLKRRKVGTSARRIDGETFRKISRWHCYAIRQMTLLRDFDGSLDWLEKHFSFPLTRTELLEAVESLAEAGLISVKPDGRIERIESFVTTENDVASESLKRFHSEILGLARESIRKFDVSERELRGLTLAIRKDKIPEAKELIRRFTDELEKLGGQPDADEVYQLGVQFFPLARS